MHCVWDSGLKLIDPRHGGCCVDSQSGSISGKHAHPILLLDLNTNVTFSLRQHGITLASQMSTCLVSTASWLVSWVSAHITAFQLLQSSPHFECMLFSVKTTYSGLPSTLKPQCSELRIDTLGVTGKQVPKSAELICISWFKRGWLCVSSWLKIECFLIWLSLGYLRGYEEEIAGSWETNKLKCFTLL